MGVEVYDLVSSGLTTATTTYASGDVLGVQMTLPMAKGYGASRRSGVIRGAVCTDDSNVIGALDLFLFGATTSPGADNAAFAPSDAEMQGLIGAISLATAFTATNNKAYTTGSSDVCVPFVAPLGSLYVVAVTRSANAVFAGGATSLRYRLFAELS
jgi:hypothetical protein